MTPFIVPYTCQKYDFSAPSARGSDWVSLRVAEAFGIMSVLCCFFGAAASFLNLKFVSIGSSILSWSSSAIVLGTLY